jgi:hypothetical protein
MRNSGPQLFLFLLILAAAITLACGSSPMVSAGCGSGTTGPNTTGTLQSVSLCPAVADAKDYPDGEVTFVPTGVYSTSPIVVTPLKTELWGVCQGGAPSDGVSVSKTGVAQCAAGASGTFSVYTSVPTYCNAVTACGGGCQISGYAQLSCP